jgi:hypothetical protein
MPSIKQLSDIHRTVTIPIEDETITVTYRLGAMNTEMSNWLEEHGGERGSLMDWIARIVTKWDIDDDGHAIPITREAMEQYLVPTPIMRLIRDTIDEDSSSGNLKTAYTSRSLDLSTSRPGTRSS